jgi:Family of unknown function (DUF695)/Regulator of ribonuclease activity B
LLDKPWEEDFDFYFSESMKARLVITVDLGAVELAPLATHPLRLQARITMQTPRADGLRQLGEADALFDLEDRLVERLGVVLPLLYVGRLVAVGDVTLVWYAPRTAEAQLEELTEAVMSVRGDYEVHLSLDRDPKWGFFDDFLFPDVYNLQVMLNRRRLMTLLEHGDDGALVRELEHLAYFESEDRALEATRKLALAGFHADSPLPEDRPSESPGVDLGWALWFGREDSLADGRIDDVCVEILDVILACEGYYDGWGVRLMGQGTKTGAEP